MRFRAAKDWYCHPCGITVQNEGAKCLQCERCQRYMAPGLLVADETVPYLDADPILRQDRSKCGPMRRRG